METECRIEIYRLYTAECLGSAVGMQKSYADFAYGSQEDDFDADEVVDGVIAKMGLGSDHEPA